MRLLAPILLIGLFIPPASAQYSVQYARILTASSLSGTVYAGTIEEYQQPLPGATISFCDRAWKDCKVLDTSDANAHFSVRPAHPRPLYYLSISGKSYNTVLIKVRLTPRAHHPLKIALPVAT